MAGTGGLRIDEGSEPDPLDPLELSGVSKSAFPESHGVGWFGSSHPGAVDVTGAPRRLHFGACGTYKE